MSTATLERTTVDAIDSDDESAEATTGSVACPHCKKQFRPAVDATQPPRLQGAKCPNCKLFVPARVVAAAFG